MATRMIGDLTPVIVGVGELADRPGELRSAREPSALMLAALQRAEVDAGAVLLPALDRLDIINEISWPYPDPGGRMAEALGRPALPTIYHPVGGQTPLLALHDSAIAIQRGEAAVIAVCGAEAERSMRQAKKAGLILPWGETIPGFQPVRGASYQAEVSRRLELASPTNVYPLYENATRASWGQSLAEAQTESATIWATNSAVAAGREEAWIPRALAAVEIMTPSTANRLIAWPYTKLMTANPLVNQGAAIIMCSVGMARSLGISPSKWVYLWGGSAADEPRDFLRRERFTKSAAMEAVLTDATTIAGRRFDHVELYSCFPVVPKMARRTLGLPVTDQLSVAGGLTFFGAPLNNYMSHATVAMVQRLREQPEALGLLYGQGEYVTKHHTLVLGSSAAPQPLSAGYRRTDVEAQLRQRAPALVDAYDGVASIESYTLLFDAGGAVRHGAIIARTAQNARVVARVPASDTATIDFLLDAEAEPIGVIGSVNVAADGLCEWSVT